MAAEISIDKTLFIQAGIFVASYVVLRKLVFGPYLELLHVRRARSTELNKKAQEQWQDAQRLEQGYESLIREERRKMSAWLEDERRRISEEARMTVQAARDRASENLKEFQSKLNQEVFDARKALTHRISEFASQLASAILGTKVTVSNKSHTPHQKEATLN